MEEIFEKYKHQYLNDEISLDELKDKLSEQEYDEFVSAISIADNYTLEDLSVEKAYQKNIERRNGQKVKKFQLRKNLALVASVIAILCIVGYIFMMNSSRQSDDGQIEYVNQTDTIEHLTLPDGSEVDLSSGSSVNYDKGNWEKERIVNLDGEAFFKVKKGETFTVINKLGSVQVLGTQFTVNTENNTFNVECFEGKVLVRYQDLEHILVKGDSFNSEEIKQSEMLVGGKSSFERETLQNVLNDIRKNYKVEISVDNSVNQNIEFSGTYFHKDAIEMTLEILCSSLNLQFQKQSETQFMISNP